MVFLTENEEKTPAEFNINDFCGELYEGRKIENLKEYTEEEAAALIIENLAYNIQHFQFNYIEYISNPERQAVTKALLLAKNYMQMQIDYKNKYEEAITRKEYYKSQNKMLKERIKELEEENSKAKKGRKGKQ